MKLSLIKQIFNVDKYILAISPSKLIIIGFYEVMKSYWGIFTGTPCTISFSYIQHQHNPTFYTILNIFVSQLSLLWMMVVCS